MFSKRKELGAEIKRLRVIRGFSTKSVYSALNITRQQLNAYECGRICLNADKIFRFCSVLALNSAEREKLMKLYSEAKKEAYASFKKAEKRNWHYRKFMVK